MNTINLQTHATEEPRESAVSRPYPEFPGLRRDTRDVLQQLNANLQQLEDKCGRLDFLLTELKSLIKR